MDMRPLGGVDQNQRLPLGQVEIWRSLHREAAMIRDILVHLPTERQVRPVVDGAVSLAASHGAHVEAVATGYVSESTAYLMEGGAALATVFELERERAISRAEAALSVFETE